MAKSEEYCHRRGDNSDTSMAKPLGYDCFKAAA